MKNPKVLVAFDFSTEAERALAWAADLTRTVGGTLHVVHVVNPLPVTAAAWPMPMAISQDNVTAIEAELRTLVSQREIPATTEVVLAPMCGDAVVGVARSQKADLIVMGTHGRGGLKRLALGSVAEHVLRHADCPVVTLRAPASA